MLSHQRLVEVETAPQTVRRRLVPGAKKHLRMLPLELGVQGMRLVGTLLLVVDVVDPVVGEKLDAVLPRMVELHLHGIHSRVLELLQRRSVVRVSHHHIDHRKEERRRGRRSDARGAAGEILVDHRLSALLQWLDQVVAIVVNDDGPWTAARRFALCLPRLGGELRRGETRRGGKEQQRHRKFHCPLPLLVKGQGIYPKYFLITSSSAKPRAVSGSR